MTQQGAEELRGLVQRYCSGSIFLAMFVIKFSQHLIEKLSTMLSKVFSSRLSKHCEFAPIHLFRTETSFSVFGSLDRLNDSPRRHQNRADQQNEECRAIMELETDIIDRDDFRLELQMRLDLGECRQHVYFCFCTILSRLFRQLSFRDSMSLFTFTKGFKRSVALIPCFMGSD